MADNKEALPMYSSEFIKRTNQEYIAWCATFYEPDALDERGMKSLHGLWAWQEQERRATSALSELRAEVERLKLEMQAIQREASEYYRRGPKIGSVLMRHELHDETLQIISHGISSSESVVIIVESNKHGTACSGTSAGEGGV